MKKIFNIIAVALVVMFVAVSCDKIEENDYLIYSGSSGDWTDGARVSNTEQRIFVEKYTGVRCVNCPAADTAITKLQQQYEHNLVAVSIHAGTLAKPWSGYEDLRTEVGDAWYGYFGIPSNPSILVNREQSNGTWNIITDANAIASAVEATMGAETQVAFEMSSVYDDASRSGIVTANLEFLKDVEGELTLTLVVIEDGLEGKQKTPQGDVEDYVFNHVFRMAITDLWGTDIDADGKRGTCREGKIKFALPEQYVAENCHIVGFISDKNTKYILQAAETSVK